MKRNQNSQSFQWKHAILWILLGISLTVLALSAGKLLRMMRYYREGRDTYSAIERTVQKPEEKEGKKNQEGRSFRPDMEALEQLNPDCIGYLYCKGVCSYPVVKGENNTYYLTHLFDHSEHEAGAIFMDSGNTGFEDLNCILYGHNMKDGSMFGCLSRFADPKFCRKHAVFRVFTRKGCTRYRVIGAFQTSADGPLYQTLFDTKEEFARYKQDLFASCQYRSRRSFSENTHILTLSTCTSDASPDWRFVVILEQETEAARPSLLRK